MKGDPHHPAPKPISPANAIQHGGTHYKGFKIQPWDFIAENGIPYLEGSAIVYIARWRDKGGLQDIDKAIHYLQKLKEVEQAKISKSGSDKFGQQIPQRD